MHGAQPFSPVKVFFISPSHSLAVSTCTEVFYSNLVKLNLFANNLCLNWRQIIRFFLLFLISVCLQLFHFWETSHLTLHLMKRYVAYRKGVWLITGMRSKGLISREDRRELLAKLLRITTAGGGRGGGESQGGDVDCQGGEKRHSGQKS